MKKTSLVVLLLILGTYCLFAQQYRIKNAEYSINGAGFKFMGATKEYSIHSKYPLDTKTVFSSLEDLETYIENYKKTLINSRHFESVEISYNTELQNNNDSEAADGTEVYDVTLMFTIQDSHHLVIMPYPKYSSNSGFTLKLKAKDTNFLGSLNTMNSDINVQYDEGKFKPGFAFNFDLPFKMGPFNSTFVNDYNFSYVVTGENTGLEWTTKTGLHMSLPFDNVSLDFGLYQYTFRNLSYIKYDDSIYFAEQFVMGLPVKLNTLPNFSNLVYSPSAGVIYYWDKNKINPQNTALSSPVVTISHSISNSKIEWQENFRKGYSFSISNTFTYDFHKKDLSPSVSAEATAFLTFKTTDYKVLNRFGICSRFNAFMYLEVEPEQYKHGASFGGRLRGVIDSSVPNYQAAITLNLDLPHNFFTTSFKHEILNFNAQFSPFVDVALVYNRDTGALFDPKDGYYCAGMEVLVYPLKWSSITVRGSYGVDVKKVLKEENKLKGLWNNKEIFIGIGLEY